MTVRHPFRGLIGGLIFGLGVGLILIFLAVAVIGSWTLIGSILVFGLVGLLYSLVVPAKRVPPNS